MTSIPDKPVRPVLVSLLWVVVAGGAALGVGWGVGRLRSLAQVPGAASQPERAGASSRGALVYQTQCAACHGPDGRGDGSGAAALRPPPRDFAVRPWRHSVTRESIRQVTLEGIPGTAMPSAKSALSPADLDAVTDHVLFLATSRPPIADELTPTQQALREAGFTDLTGGESPSLTVTDAGGKTVKLASLKGQLVLVHFWGTGCVHCLKEMPHLHSLEQKWASRGLKVLHVCADAEDAASAQQLADPFAPGVRAVVDESGLGIARFGVQVLPTFWLIGPDARPLGRRKGPGTGMPRGFFD